jgi:hypothetical protein
MLANEHCRIERAALVRARLAQQERPLAGDGASISNSSERSSGRHALKNALRLIFRQWV